MVWQQWILYTQTVAHSKFHIDPFGPWLQTENLCICMYLATVTAAFNETTWLIWHWFKIMFCSRKLRNTPYTINITHVWYRMITMLEWNPHLQHHVCTVKDLLLHICFNVRLQLPIEIWSTVKKDVILHCSYCSCVIYTNWVRKTQHDQETGDTVTLLLLTHLHSPKLADSIGCVSFASSHNKEQQQHIHGEQM